MPANSTTPSSRSRMRTAPVAAPVSAGAVVSLMASLPVAVSMPAPAAAERCVDEAGTGEATALASPDNKKTGGNHEIGTLSLLANARRCRRLVRGGDVCATRDRQGAAPDAAHHGPARREAETARRADHESVERRP